MKDTFLLKSMEKNIEQYDKSFMYILAFFAGIAAFISKDFIGPDSDFENAIQPGSLGSFMVLGLTYFWSVIIAWYTYVSVSLSVGSSIVKNDDDQYRQFLLNRTRIRFNRLYVIISHAVIFMLQAIPYLYYFCSISIDIWNVFGALLLISVFLFAVTWSFRIYSLVFINRILGNS